jgi:hypothetical protein
LRVADLSTYGQDRQSPLTKYLGPEDLRYKKLGARVLVFVQEFGFFNAVTNALISQLTKILEQEGLDPDMRNSSGKTALHIAAEQGHRDIVTTLVLWSANINLKTLDEKTALQIAVEKLDRNMVEMLLVKGARPDARYNNGTPLWDLSDLRLQNDDRDAVRKAISSLLKDPPLVDGPFMDSLLRHARPLRRQSQLQDWLSPPPQPYGEIACKAFDVTIANFFLTDAGQEIFGISTTPIHDILYCTAPSDINRRALAQAEKIQTGLGKTGLTWYHIPANNVSNSQFAQFFHPANK